MFFSQAACTIYLIFEMGTETKASWIKIIAGIILAIKTGLENLAISLQIYEWLCLYTMIKFQGEYNMDRVEVVLDQFKKIEKRQWCFFKTFLSLIVFAGVLIDLLCIVKSDNKNQNWNDWTEILDYQKTVGFLLLSFLIITVFLFFSKALKRQNAEFHEHKVMYSIQASGMFLAIVTNLVLDFVIKKHE